MLITLADIRAAQARIAPAAVRTPLVRLTRARVKLAGYSELAESMPDIYLKDESAQPIGSFKLRGAYNKIAQLTSDELQRGVITYSSGNHAQGVAYAARALGAKSVIVMPENAPRIKREATAALGAEIVTVGLASTERRLKAEALEAEHGYTMVPPYDDPAIIAGQGTCGLEILEQLSDLSGNPTADLILSPVSGGGLLSGVATAVKLASVQAGSACFGGDGLQRVRPFPSSGRDFPGADSIPVWGCEPALAADAHESFTTKTLTEWPAADTTRTLCDGLRTQSLGELNFEHILRFVDGIVTITEEEIRTATRIILTATSLTAEPSGAITLAAALFHPHELSPAHEPSARMKVVAILSGGNLDPTLRSELTSELAFATV